VWVELPFASGGSVIVTSTASRIVAYRFSRVN
jgi:hypothetical protein